MVRAMILQYYFILTFCLYSEGGDSRLAFLNEKRSRLNDLRYSTPHANHEADSASLDGSTRRIRQNVALGIYDEHQNEALASSRRN